MRAHRHTGGLAGDRWAHRLVAVCCVQVDVDELGGLAAELGISSMPTFLFYKSGEIIHTMRGADEAKLREKVAELV